MLARTTAVHNGHLMYRGCLRATPRPTGLTPEDLDGLLGLRTSSRSIAQLVARRALRTGAARRNGDMSAPGTLPQDARLVAAVSKAHRILERRDGA